MGNYFYSQTNNTYDTYDTYDNNDTDDNFDTNDTNGTDDTNNTNGTNDTNDTNNTDNLNRNYMRYGWNKDDFDVRDVHHNFNISQYYNVIKCVDMRDKCPRVYDQGNLESCTGNAIAGAYEFDEIRQCEGNIFTPSRLFIYYNERAMKGTIDSDSGASIRDGIKTVNKIGACSEDMWSYDITKFTEKPSEKCYKMSHLTALLQLTSYFL